MRIATIDVTCTDGPNSARFTADACYMGRCATDYPEGHPDHEQGHDGDRVGIFNCRATKVSGGDFLAKAIVQGPCRAISHADTVHGAMGTDGVSWADEPVDYLVFGPTGDGQAPRRVTLTAHLYVRWTGDDEYAHAESKIAVVVPECVEPAAHVTYDANVPAGEALAIPVPVGASYNPSASVPGITLTNVRPARADHRFARWSTARDGGGETYLPGEEFGGTRPDTLLYANWDPYVYFDANGGSAGPLRQAKPRGQAMEIPTSVPTKSGSVCTGWNTERSGTGTAYAAGGTIPAGMNEPMTLYAQWRPTTPAPQVQAMSAVRCDEDGCDDDTGPCCKVTVSWRAYRTYDQGNTGTLTGRIQREGLSARTIRFEGDTGGAGGLATAIVPDVDADGQYVVTATVTDTNGDAGHVNSTSRSAILTRARFLLDFKAGGGAVGIGSAAPERGLAVGFDTTFAGDVEVAGDVLAANLTVRTHSGDEVIRADGGSSRAVSAAGCAFGPIRTLSAELKVDGDVRAGHRVTLGLTCPDYAPPARMGFADDNGVGYVTSGGLIYYVPGEDMPAGSTAHVSITFVTTWAR